MAQTGSKSDGQSAARKTAYGDEAGVEAGVETMTLGYQYTRTIDEELLCQLPWPGLPRPALTRMMALPVCD